MMTIAWKFVKPYLSNVVIWVMLVLVVFCTVQSIRCYTKQTIIDITTVKLTAANEKLATQTAEFTKLKAFSDALDVRLQKAYADNVEAEKRHAVTVKVIMDSMLPDTATCDDTAKWARDIAKMGAK